MQCGLGGNSKWSTAWPSRKCSSNIFCSWAITSTSLRVWTIGSTTNQQSPKSFSSLKVIAPPSWPDSHSYSAWYVWCFSTVRMLNVSCEPTLIPTHALIWSVFGASNSKNKLCSNSDRKYSGQFRIFFHYINITKGRMVQAIPLQQVPYNLNTYARTTVLLLCPINGIFYATPHIQNFLKSRNMHIAPSTSDSTFVAANTFQC